MESSEIHHSAFIIFPMSSYWKYSELSELTPELMERVLLNSWQAREGVADVLDEWPNARVVADGRTPDVVEYNHVGMLRAGDEDADKALSKAERFFTKRGRTPALVLDPMSTPADLSGRLTERGWQQRGPADDLMLWDAGARHIYTAPEVYNVMATNATLNEWIRIATCADPPHIAAQRAALLPLAFRAPGHFFWFALFDGAQAGAGAMFVRDGVAQVGGVTVLPEYRRKGVGLALQNFLTRQSRKDGAEETYTWVEHGCVMTGVGRTCGYHVVAENARTTWTLST